MEMSPARILLVMGENIVRAEIQAQLRDLEYIVAGTAATGEEAVEKASRGRPDLVLIDINLKGRMDSAAVARRIRERCDIPVIYLAGDADDDTLRRVKASGPCGCIVKPFMKKELCSIIETARAKHEMERRLAVSEQRLAAALRNISDAVIVTDAESRVTFMNSPAETLTGWRQEEVIGKDLAECFRLISQTSREATENPLKEMLREGNLSELADQTILVAKDGGKTPIDCSAASVQDGSGDVTGAVLVFRDASERRRAEEEVSARLRRIKHREAAIARLSTNQAFVFGDLQRAFKIITETMAEALEVERTSLWMLSGDRQELRCVDLFQRTPGRHAKGFVLPARDCPRYIEALESGRSIDAHDTLSDPRTSELQERYLDPNGITSKLDSAIRAYGVLIGVVCCEHADTPRRWRTEEVVFASEIADQVVQVIQNNQRRRAEEALLVEKAYLEALFESAQEAIVMTGNDGRVLRINREFSRLFGYTHEEAVGRLVDDLVAPNEQHDEAAAITKRVSQRESISLEGIRFRKDGAPVHVSILGSPIVVRGEQVAVYGIYRDISKRKRTEEELGRQKALLDEIFSGVQEGIGFVDATETITFCNPAFADIFEQDTDQLIGKSLFEIFPQEAHALLWRQTEERKQGKISTYELPLVTPKGSTKHICVTVSPRFAEDGSYIGTIGAVIDITERKQTEEALLVEKAQLEALFESAREAIVMADNNGVVMRTNSEFTRLFGYTQEEALGRSVDDLVAPGQLRDQAIEITKQVSRSESVSIETVRRRKDGSPVQVSILGSPIVIHGEPVAVYAIYRDITHRKEAEKDLQRKTLQQERLLQATGHLTESLEVEDVLTRIGSEAKEILKGRSCVIYLLEKDNVTLTPMVAIDPDYQEESLATAISVETSFTGQAVKKKRGLIFNNASESPLGQQIPGTPVEEDERVIVVPFCIGDKGLGAMCLTRKGTLFREEDLALAEAFATYATTALKNAQTYDELQKEIEYRNDAERKLRESSRKIEGLHRTARSLEGCKSEREAYRLTIEAAEKILALSMCSLDVVEGNKLVVKATTSELPAGASIESDLDETSLAAKTYRTGRTIIFGSLDEVPEASPTRADFKSGISAPLGEFGVFQVGSDEPDAFSKEDASLLELLLGHAAEAIQRIRLQNRLRDQATRDPLTGVFNRRYFRETIERELERSRRSGNSIGFLLVDVDRFKRINDTYGHQTGDRVLREVADFLKSQVRASEMVVRFGGDEFLIVITELTDSTDTMRQRLMEAFSRWNEMNKVFDFPIKLSIGGACWSPGGSGSVEEILARADRQMYEDKRKRSLTPSSQ